MIRVYGPRLDLGYRFLHEHDAPFPELPVFTHVSEAICEPSHVREPHFHSVFEICYILAGKGVRIIDGEHLAVGPGDLYITNPGERHGGRADPSDPYHYFAIGFAPSQLAIMAKADRKPHPANETDLSLAIAETKAIDDGLRLPDQRVIHGCEGAETIFRRILLELDRTQDGDQRKRTLMLVMVQALMVELLVFTSRCAIAQQENLPLTNLRLRQPVRSDFQELLSWLKARVSDPPSLAEMANRVGLSPAHLAVAFKREIGQTPLEFMTGLRIEEAGRRLIGDPNESITSIAIDLGFSSSQYFSLVFRKTLGCTPSQWRSRNAKLR